MDKIVHFEIPADDIERAKKFYKNVFGWEIVSIPDMGYNILRTGPTSDDGMPHEKGFINGGMLQRNECVKNPVVTINVEDIEKSLEEIKKAGGKIVKEPMKIGNMGLAAYFQDTEGNVVGLWQSLGSN